MRSLASFGVSLLIKMYFPFRSVRKVKERSLNRCLE